MSLDISPARSDDDRADSDALRLRDDWGDLSKRLTRFAYHWTRRRSTELAEEIAQEAIRQALDPAYKPWDPALQPDFFRFLCGLAIGVAANRRKRHAARRERATPDHELALAAGANDVSPEREAATRERAAKAFEALRRRVHGDATCAALLVALEEGVDGPEAMAEATGIALDEVRVARRRLARHVEATLAELDREEDGRG